MTELYTTQQVALELGRSYDHVRKLLTQLEPVQVIGRNQLWSKSQLEAVRKLIRNSSEVKTN